MSSFRLVARGRYSLAAQAAFLRGFAPALHDAAGPAIDLAFPVERDWSTARVHIAEDGPGAVTVTAPARPPRHLEAQVARMLSLDVDGAGYPEVGRRDPRIAALQEASGWLRPISFPSPYEAAVWGVLSQRTPMAVAARLKRALADRLGERGAFPAPAVLTELDAFASVPAIKVARLRAVARAALDGVLDGERLRALPTAEALGLLRAIDGVGPFTAQLILIRGAGAPDVLPSGEGRLAEAVARVYGARARLEAVSEAWRPFRSWVAVLLRSFG